jgi:AMP nucleosidase
MTHTHEFTTRAGLSPLQAIEALIDLHSQATERLKSALDVYLSGGPPPSAEYRASGAFAYPELRVRYLPDGPPPPTARAFAKFTQPGTYVSTITRPAFFRDYLLEQLETLARDYPIHLEVATSSTEIPYPYVWDEAGAARLEQVSPVDLAHFFPHPKLAFIGDEVADGEPFDDHPDRRPLALFDAARVDFSLQRIKHYTGTPFDQVQPFILFTNYHRYVDAFIDWAVERIREPGPYTRLAAPGGIVVDANTKDPQALIAAGPWRRCQMPGYHLLSDSGPGISLINIGVGPSNAKNITDHLAVLRPQVWLMVGHCGGLRHSQRIGDYVLAHAYLRDDHVLDTVLPPDIPVPALAEVQLAMQQAAAEITGDTGEALKRRLRTGTVVTTDDRNWELRFTASSHRFNQSRAIAIDMESATIAANGFRLRVPYGTLLCVSDKPLHGEIKLPGAANRFYDRAVMEHIRIGIRSLEVLMRDDGAALHSRKLRSFDEPPFR